MVLVRKSSRERIIKDGGRFVKIHTVLLVISRSFAAIPDADHSGSITCLLCAVVKESPGELV